MAALRIPPSHRASAMTVPRDDLKEAGDVLIPSPAQFQKLFLAPEQAVAGRLRLTFANPTPVAVAGFLLTNTPATIDLMGWGGAGGGVGNTSASIGAFFYLGAVLLYIGAIGEWILGNTFPCCVFFTYGGFWGAYAATLMPFYNASATYETPAAFYNSVSMFLICVGVISFMYAIAAIRTNVCLLAILVSYTIACPFLASSYMYSARGRDNIAETTRIAAGAFGFIASIMAWYLFFSLILESVNFPYILPVGDLSTLIKGKCDIVKEENAAEQAAEKAAAMA